MNKSLSLVLTALLLGCTIGAAPAAIAAEQGEASAEVLSFEGQHGPLWHLKGAKPYLIGGYGDNFNYSGTNVTPLLGKAKVLLDARKNTGTMALELAGTIVPEKGKSHTGKIKIYYRIGKGGPDFQEGGVADFIYMHGDTGQGAPVMPKVRTYLAAWGEADVYVNGDLVYEGLDGHMMYTERSRHLNTKAIYNSERTGFYDPKNPSDFSIASPNERELHFVAHSTKEDTENFPPHSVWIHLNFEQVHEGERGPGLRSGGTCGPGCGCGCQAGGPCGCGAKAGGPCGHGPECGCGCGSGAACSCGGPAKPGSCGAGGCGHTRGCTAGGCGVSAGGCGHGAPGCGSGGCGVQRPGCGHKAAGCGASIGCSGRSGTFGKSITGKCGHGPDCGCGCASGAPCKCTAPSAAQCGPGCACGCQSGGPCSCGGSEVKAAPCGPGCQCGCKAGGACSCAVKAKTTPCGPGCGCGCATGAPCTCH